jgi:hypothetical protein
MQISAGAARNGRVVCLVRILSDFKKSAGVRNMCEAQNTGEMRLTCRAAMLCIRREEAGFPIDISMSG